MRCILLVVAVFAFICETIRAQGTDERVEMLRRQLQEPDKDAVIIDQIEGAPPIPQQTPQPAQSMVPPVAKPQEEAVPASAESLDQSSHEDSEKVWVLDPRDALTNADIATDGFEATGITMNRTFVVAGYASEQDEKDSKPLWTKSAPVKIPIMHRTRQLALDKETATRAKTVLARLETLAAKARDLKAEAKELLTEWNAIVTAGTPHEILTADSPSLPANQGADPLNRGTSQEGLEAGKGVTFKLEEENE